MSFVDNPNSIGLTALTYAFLAMALMMFIGCCYKIKCKEIICCKVIRDIRGEIEVEDGNRDIIPAQR